MLSCIEVTRLVSESLDRELSIPEKFRLKTHLMMCKGCTNFREQMTFLRTACKRYASEYRVKGR